jgi:D-aspartate ligase
MSDTKNHKNAPQSTRRAIVLGCNSISLAVIEALASNEVQVLAVSISRRPRGRYTRGSVEVVQAPDIYKDRGGLIDYLLALPGKWSGALIYPTTDAGVSLLSTRRDDLQVRFHVSVPAWDRIGPLFDTRKLYPIARELGIALPWYLVPDEESEIHARRSEIPFPCIVKPGVSDRFVWKFKKKAFIAANFEQLIDFYRQADRANIPVLISEIIAGGDDQFIKYCTYRDRSGEFVSSLCLRKLRQHPTGFGVARASITVAMIPEPTWSTNRLLERVGFRGVCSAEFKYDPRDGQYKLIEVNVRPQLQERLLLHAGINFPFTAYLDWVEGRSDPVESYNEGLYWIDMYHDVLDYFRWNAADDHSPGRYFKPYFHPCVLRTPLWSNP